MKYPKILFIDDDLDDQEIFMMAIEEISSELECIISKNSDEALDKLSKKEIAANLIFLDLNLPASSGQDFLKKIKVIDGLKEIPVIIFSTSSDPLHYCKCNRIRRDRLHY